MQFAVMLLNPARGREDFCFSHTQTNNDNIILDFLTFGKIFLLYTHAQPGSHDDNNREHQHDCWRHKYWN